MTDVQLFTNSEFELSIEYRNDAIQVYGPLVADALGFRNAADLARFLPEHCKILVKNSVSAGRGVHALTRARSEQGIWYLTEEGFYRAIGQRITSRIRDEQIRGKVERFQSWVFGEVLPAIRKHGHYSITEPVSLTWEQAAQRLYQQYGLQLTAGQITNALRAAGVLRQNGNPRTKYQDWFWMTSAGTVNVLDFVLPKIAAKITETRSNLLERQQWYQLRLQLDPTG